MAAEWRRRRMEPDPQTDERPNRPVSRIIDGLTAVSEETFLRDSRR